jgi:hypothetical protein
LELCRNLRPWSGGLAPYEPIRPAFDNDTLAEAGIVADWPFPQLFRGREVTLLATRDAVYLVLEASWTLVLLETATPITAGGIWHFADFGSAWLLSNGACLVYQRADTFDVLVANVAIGAMCAHDSRLFIGGFDFLESGDSDWQDTVDGWITKAPTGFDTTLGGPPNIVWWSNVGTLALFWWLLDLTTATTGDLSTHNTAHPLVRELMLRRDWGFAPVTFQGGAQELRSFGNAVIAFGPDGATAFAPRTDPVTCAITQWPSGGIAHRGALAATDGRLLWLDPSKSLWSASGGSAPARLDYSEFGTTLGANVLGAADLEQGTLFLSDGSNSLMLTEGGLAFAPECPTSLIHVEGELRGIVYDVPEAGQMLEVVTNAHDMGSPGMKTVETLVVTGGLPEGATATVDFRDSPLESWTRDTRRELNDEGVVDNIHCTAQEFRVVIESNDWQGASIDGIEVQWIQQDQRFVSRLTARASSVIEA